MPCPVRWVCLGGHRPHGRRWEGHPTLRPVRIGFEGGWLPQRPESGGAVREEAGGEETRSQVCFDFSGVGGGRQQGACAHPPLKRITVPPKGTKSLDQTRGMAQKQGQLNVVLPPVLGWPCSQTA